MASNLMTLLWLTQQQPPFAEAAEQGAVGKLQGKGILWVDLGRTPDRGALTNAIDALQLVDLELPMLGHILEGVGPDAYGADRVAGYDEHVARSLATGKPATFLHAFALKADIAVAPIADQDLPRVYRQDVHFLVGSRWVMTSRKRGYGVTRGIPFDGDAFEYEDLLRYLERNWTGTNEPADAATLMLRALVGTHASAVTAVGGRLQNSELAYMRGLDDPIGGGNLDEREYRQELVDVKWIVDGLSNWVNGLTRPAVNTRVAWFNVVHASAEASEVGTLLDHAGKELTLLREQLRQSFDLIASTQASRQIELARRDQRRGQRLEQVVTVVTATLLVPGLVAATIEALPALFEYNLHARAALLLSLMVGLGVVSYSVLTFVRTRSNADEAVALLPEDPAPTADLARLDRVAVTSGAVGLVAATGAYGLVVILEANLALQIICATMGVVAAVLGGLAALTLRFSPTNLGVAAAIERKGAVMTAFWLLLALVAVSVVGLGIALAIIEPFD